MASAPEPVLKEFYFSAHFYDGQRLHAPVGGTYRREKMMERDELMAAYSAQAREFYTAKGSPDAVPTRLMIAQHYEVPAFPKPAASDTRPMKHWKVWADLVVHDIKYGDTIQGVFAWPEEPAGAPLWGMLKFLAAKSIASRGDDPGYADEAEISGVKVTLTDEPPTYS